MGNFTKETRPKFNLALTLVVISSIAVLLRFLARARTKAKYAADDWWILVALLLYYVYFGVGIWSKLNPPGLEGALLNAILQVQSREGHSELIKA